MGSSATLRLRRCSAGSAHPQGPFPLPALFTRPAESSLERPPGLASPLPLRPLGSQADREKPPALTPLPRGDWEAS